MAEDILGEHCGSLLYHQVASDCRPSSVSECLHEDGTIDLEKYLDFSDKERELSKLERNQYEALQQETDEEKVKQNENTNQRRVRTRRSKTLRPFYFDDDGNVIYLEPTRTTWYLYYVKATSAAFCPKFHKKFRRRFRMPHTEFVWLLHRVKSSGDFDRWLRCDAVGQKPPPISLLLLGALRYLGRGLTFDDLEEYTAVSEETHRQFFHCFIDYGANTMYPEHVITPRNAASFETHRNEFDMGGLHGAGFSTDGTNVVMWCCEHNLKQANMGFKQSHAARTYNVTVNHRREILHSTAGHPSRWNDKTLAWFDSFLCGLHDGKILQDVEFFLYEWEGDVAKSPTRKQKYRGAWGLVDNGYHKWACTQAPAKVHVRVAELRLSEFIESFRKDSECVFGILKGRWRVLKTGIRVHGCLAADKIFLTCCALHNMLLRIDGLNKEWKNGVSSDYEGELGENDPRDAYLAPFAIQRLNGTEMREFGSHDHLRASQAEAAAAGPVEGRRLPMFFGDDLPESDEQEIDERGDPQQADDGALYVNSLSYSDFRERLVAHFDILYRRNKIVWPKRK